MQMKHSATLEKRELFHFYFDECFKLGRHTGNRINICTLGKQSGNVLWFGMVGKKVETQNTLQVGKLQ